MTPLMAVAPRLEEEFRYDMYYESTKTGQGITNYDAGKGLKLIATTTNETLINLPRRPGNHQPIHVNQQ
jgi:hypothetical protein